MPTRLDEVYIIGKSKVTLSVTTGNAQTGSSLVKLDGVEIGSGENIQNLVIGSNIIGKTLDVKTTVIDVSDKTNVVTVSYSLKGGKEDKNYVLPNEISEEGGILTFFATFKFQG